MESCRLMDKLITELSVGNDLNFKKDTEKGEISEESVQVKGF